MIHVIRSAEDAHPTRRCGEPTVSGSCPAPVEDKETGATTQAARVCARPGSCYYPHCGC